MKHALAIACGPCWRPRWHPEGAMLSVDSTGGGTIIHVDESSSYILGKHLEWGPDGKMALAKSRTSPCEVILWPEDTAVSRLPPGKYCWTDTGVLARATRQNIITLSLMDGGAEETSAIKPPSGERWVWVHGLGMGMWAALRWNQAEQAVGLSRWRGDQWPVEHFRLPQIEGLLPVKWDWSVDNDSWILLAHQRHLLMGWTFPQGLEWLGKASSTRAACLSDRGVFWSEGSTVIYLDRTSQEITEWTGIQEITGMSWNQKRRCLALASRKGVDILLT